MLSPINGAIVLNRISSLFLREKFPYIIMVIVGFHTLLI